MEVPALIVERASDKIRSTCLREAASAKAGEIQNSKQFSNDQNTKF